MAPPFILPPNLHSLEEEDADGSRLTVQNLTSISSLRSSEQEEFVKGVSYDLTDKELFCIEEQDVFDRVYSLVKDFSKLSPPCKLNLVESLRSNLSVLLPNVDLFSRSCQNQDGRRSDDDSDQGDDEDSSVSDRLASHRNAFKIYSFFLMHIVLIEEFKSTPNNSTKVVMANGRKKQHVSTWNWDPQRAKILTLIANSLEINLTVLFGSSDPDENYLSFIVKNTFTMYEKPTILKDSVTRDALNRIIATCATKFHHTAQSCASILHLIHKYDYTVPHLADAVAGAEKKFADGTLATSLIREIGRTNPTDYVKDAVGAENIGRFLVELADQLPKLVSTNVGLLIPHFDGESYKIRNALVGVFGKLVAKAFNGTEGEMSLKSISLRTKQKMLEMLLERCRDVSAYTRSRVLQVWAELCEEHSVSIGMWNEVAALAAGRLEDKSAIVRKSALNLLIVMLQHNPFGPQLRISTFEATLEQYKKKLNALGPPAQSETVLNGEDCNWDGKLHVEGAEGMSKELNDSLTDSCLSQMQEHTTHKDNYVPDVGTLEETRTLVASLETALQFSKCMSATMSTLVQLMASSSATDVENTILLLMRCRQFQIDGSEACLRRMLPLVFSQDKAIHEAVENAFITIYIQKNPIETAKNLLCLAIDSNIGDLAALELIIGELVSKGDITSSMLSALWDFFCFNIGGTTAKQSRGALSVLCMAAKTSTVVFSSHLSDIIDIGFGRWAKVEPLLASTACTALQRLSEEDRKKLLFTNGRRVFGILESLVIGHSLPQSIWYATADKAITTIYTIHHSPEKVAVDLVKRSLSSVLDCSGGEELQTDIENGSSNLNVSISVPKLSKYLFIVSHVAMNHLVYIESLVRKIQKERVKKERMVSEQNADNASVEAQKDKSINAELGVAASEDALLDALAERAEKEIISGGPKGKLLIGHCAPFLSKLCRNYAFMQKFPELQASGMLSLCRFMIIDAAFCDENLQLLFTVVENAPSETVRLNCTVALGDLAVRFPNLLEPWTEHMYARLRDPSISVRKNAVLVLSHLILNDMMKVKGYINEMTICLEDEDVQISSLAKLFFHELSKKGSNPIYNLLPDILGKLSTQNLKQESFCNIMQFLIGSIKKDRQMEALVEKLCIRFSGVTDVRQWEYISYCLSQLTFNEKSMKKLIELFKTYEHALSEDAVMDHFQNIITKVKKFSKPEVKSCIEEFEEKINRFHIEKKEQELAAKNAQRHQEKMANLESFMASKKEVEESSESEVTEGGAEGEVNDPSTEGSTKSTSREIKSTEESNADSCASSELTTDTELEENEVQSPLVHPIVASRSSQKKPNKVDQVLHSFPSSKTLRSKRR
ncbi:unnamed protein product [Cuscuta campestris]|uniref:Condensin-1 complex subunit CAP-D2 n=1 Tax=Cuscuta campestris TaxID=132261 RepID=A0A484L5T6_9ASTE|nr:unnamed protein product [Cuscuta campestris]